MIACPHGWGKPGDILIKVLTWKYTKARLPSGQNSSSISSLSRLIAAITWQSRQLKLRRFHLLCCCIRDRAGRRKLSISGRSALLRCLPPVQPRILAHLEPALPLRIIHDNAWEALQYPTHSHPCHLGLSGANFCRVVQQGRRA